MTQDQDYQWRHGWVPLTMHAALQKTRGDHEAAAALLAEARRRRQRRGEVVFTSPHPAHRAQHTLRSASDDDLAAAMGTADEAELGRIVAELDRRDRAAAKAARDAASRPARRRAQRTAEDQRRSADFDAACQAGEDPEAAYSRVYGVTEEKQRREEATASLREAGWSGTTFAAMVRTAHAEHVRQESVTAEEVTSGNLLNAAGQRAGIDPESLWSGPAARAKKYASEELMDYWRNGAGRMTVADFTAGLLGGSATFRTAGDDW